MPVNQSALRRGELGYGRSNAQSGVKPVQITLGQAVCL
ncbi:hypothetical protein GECvBN6_gp206 [Salmonella phage GEC_vB_N6]|nr:hypothetical protein GECvBGOT_gp179 [Salmonella phage GEC_vB_GOT]QPI15409.1 hypothetical protein GECvBN6_gp206 [Salmonella phage GEC_vB_N6]WDS51287.1 hypothetical protein SeF3a_209 [Salmonella phage SeF3a]